MNIIEYGKENQQKIMLLHGGGLSWSNYGEAAELLKDRYRVILPILDGHAGSSRCFNSIEENAEALLHYIDEYCQGHILYGIYRITVSIICPSFSRSTD